MELNFFILFVLLLNALATYGDTNNEHIHFKIYVPEIINQHVHTRTVFIHVHHPPKKKKQHKNLATKNYQDNWSSYRTYEYHNDHGIQKNIPIYHGILTQKNIPNVEIYNNPVAPIPFYDDYRGNTESAEDKPDSSEPSKMNFGYGVTGYSYPPQYETHEDIKEDIPSKEIASYENVEYDEGHNAGHAIKSGHVYTNERNKFYGNKHEESSEKYVDGSSEDNYRYLNNRYVDHSDKQK